MSNRVQLTPVRFSSALRDALTREPYTLSTLRADVLAGLTVAIVAIPLAMALAIASGVPPQYGLYSAIVGGFVAALVGGSRYSVSGPTAAFVVILAPITAKYGMAGLATAGLMAGVILFAFAVLRIGRLIEYVPEPVTVGFTSGIAVVIAVLQLNDFLGLGLTEMPEAFLGKIGVIAQAIPHSYWAVVLVGAVTLLVKILWPQERLLIPGYAPAIVVGTLLSLLLAQLGHPVDTIGSRFTFEVAGVTGHGIPQMLPHLSWPWALPGPNGEAFVLSWQSVRDLIPAAFSIAVLGAIESLLCAVVLDRSTRTHHHSNGELLGQGIANITTPFFGGVPVTAAIARSAANVSAGGRTPLAAAVHAVSVLIGVLILAPALSYIPMAAMAAVLLTVAWNMSEAKTAVSLLKRAPRPDKLVFIVCFSLTVVFDMVLAIAVGIALAAFLFMGDIARFTQTRDVTNEPRYVSPPLPADWRVYKIIGAMFFAAADRVLTQLLNETADGSNLIIYADGITLLDAGGTSAFERFFEECESRHIRVIITNMQAQTERALKASGIGARARAAVFTATLPEAIEMARTDTVAA